MLILKYLLFEAFLKRKSCQLLSKVFDSMSFSFNNQKAILTGIASYSFVVMASYIKYKAELLWQQPFCIVLKTEWQRGSYLLYLITLTYQIVWMESSGTNVNTALSQYMDRPRLHPG